MFPVYEVFGPTVGEDALAGVPTHVIRFGGFCAMTTDEIIAAVDDLPPGPSWASLNGDLGGLALGDVVSCLRQKLAMKVCVETPCSGWQDWLYAVDLLTISPKPGANVAETDAFMEKAYEVESNAILKVDVLDEADLVWAIEFFGCHRGLPAYLSFPPEFPFTRDEAVVARHADRYARLAYQAVTRAPFATVLPPLQVLVRRF